MAEGDEQRTAKVEPLRKALPCPECRRPSTRENYPFCSDRCRQQGAAQAGSAAKPRNSIA